MRFAIKSVLKLEAKRPKLLRIANPSALVHPFLRCLSFSSNHYEDGSVAFKELVIDVIPLIRQKDDCCNSSRRMKQRNSNLLPCLIIHWL